MRVVVLLSNMMAQIITLTLKPYQSTAPIFSLEKVIKEHYTQSPYKG